VHVSSLGSDYYRHDPERHRLVGRRTRQAFQLGDRLRVRVVRAGLDDRRIDFELADQATSPRRKGRSKGRSKRR